MPGCTIGGRKHTRPSARSPVIRIPVVILAGAAVLLFTAAAAAVVPRPLSLVRAQGEFALDDKTQILTEPSGREVAAYLQDLLAAPTGWSLPVIASVATRPEPGSILLTSAGADPQLGDEGYILSVTEGSIVIRATAPAGLFYGVQTLRQLLPPEVESREKVSGVKWTIPAGTVRDRPRFRWRGMHLDTGRHMFPVAFVKRYIDLLAVHKLNVFHWHLTEDQGWRLAIEAYPRLATVGAWRAATPVPANRDSLDGRRYGGFYTREEVREVVAHAASRHVTVVPEIEMPGHSQAALASYPELGCTGGPYEVATTWGVHREVYCAGNEEVFTFLETVLDEVLALFPGPFIHIGGDECPKDRWRDCERCQAAITRLGLADEHELQSWFIGRMTRFLDDRGRRAMGWSEILEGGLPPGTAVMSWLGPDAGITAARAGHDVVMSPTSHCYFDYYQSEDRDREPPAIGGFLPLEKVYELEPVPDDFTEEEAGHVLGAQGNVWTEYIPTTEQVEYMAFPRAAALAEVVWSPREARDLEDFLVRLKPHLERLQRLDVNFRDPFADPRSQ